MSKKGRITWRAQRHGTCWADPSEREHFATGRRRIGLARGAPTARGGGRAGAPARGRPSHARQVGRRSRRRTRVCAAPVERGRTRGARPGAPRAAGCINCRNLRLSGGPDVAPMAPVFYDALLAARRPVILKGLARRLAARSPRPRVRRERDRLCRLLLQWPPRGGLYRRARDQGPLFLRRERHRPQFRRRARRAGRLYGAHPRASG